MIVLRVFSVELALKSLIAKILNEKPESTHSLTRLFDKLPRTTKDSLDRRFQLFRKGKPSYKGETDSLREVLTLHENAFMEWRYLDQGDLHTNPNVLNSVLDALWEAYRS